MKEIQTVRLMRWDAVCSTIGLCRRSITTMIAKGTFPAPLKIGPAKRVSAWLPEDIEAWVAGSVRESHRGGTQ